MYNDSNYCILKMLINVFGILCFIVSLSADEILLSSNNTLRTPNTDVGNSSIIFGSNAEFGNDSLEIWSPHPIALEGGSSIIANDTKVSDTIGTNRSLGNWTSVEISTVDHNTVTTSKPRTLIQFEEPKEELRPRINTTVDSNIKTNETDTTYFSKDPLQFTLEESDHPSVVPRKGVSPKIVPRKGAEPFEPFSVPGNDTEIKSECRCCETANEQQRQNYTTDTKCILCCNTSESEALSVNNTDDNHLRTDKKNQSGLISKVNATLNVTDIYRTSPTLKKKVKPLITLGDDGEEKQILMRSSSSENNDFVIPVVLVILAVPIAIVLAMIFYRKGTEFWERRHYKRMDFLIDGMYND